MTSLKSALLILGASTFLFSLAQPQVLAQAADTGWQTMSIDGATVHFEMPKPIKMDKDLSSGMVVYVSKKGKMSMKVGIINRNFAKDQAQGLTDSKVLDNFALRTLAGNKISFKKLGFQTNYNFDCDLKLATGVGKQYSTRVGKAFVMNRFYINKQGLYYVEAITQNTQDPDINRFLKSFRP